MGGSIDSTSDSAERLFVARFGPGSRSFEWVLRIRPLELWTDRQRAEWLALIAEGFVRLAAVGGLCGERGRPTETVFADDVEVWDIEGGLEWQFGRLAIDPGAATLLLNLCDWATLHIAPAAVVEVLGHGLAAGPESPDRPLPRRTRHVSFAVEDIDLRSGGTEIQTEFAREPSPTEVEQIRRLLRPWYSALIRWDFALHTVPTGASEVRPVAPPLLIAGDLWYYQFDRFDVRPEVIDVYVNCLDRVHHTICPVRCVAFT